jgi:hypothetical protein
VIQKRIGGAHRVLVTAVSLLAVQQAVGTMPCAKRAYSMVCLLGHE